MTSAQPSISPMGERVLAALRVLCSRDRTAKPSATKIARQVYGGRANRRQTWGVKFSCEYLAGLGAIESDEYYPVWGHVFRRYWLKEKAT